MTSQNEVDKCSSCGRLMEDTFSDKWKLPSGEMISVGRCATPYILMLIGTEEFCLCENCYLEGKFLTDQSETIGKIHCEFGREYVDFERYSESLDALHKALTLLKTADVLAATAYSYGASGDLAMEKEFYHQALRLDPKHGLSLANLAVIEQQERENG